MKRSLLFLAFLVQHSFSFGQTQIPLDSFYVPGTSWTEVAGYGPNAGSFMALAGDNQRPMMKVNVKIITDKDGNFIGVMQNGKVISISDWNKQYQSQSTKLAQ